jgi:small-conductance mechanosensitive channel
VNTIFTYDFFFQQLQVLKNWVLVNVFVWENLAQIALQIAALLAARLIGTLIGRWFRGVLKNRIKDHDLRYDLINNFLNRLLKLTPLIFSVFVLWVFIQGVSRSGYQTYLMRLVLNLSVAWVIVQLATSIILDRFWSRLIAALTWSLAALNIVGILDQSLALLQSIGFTLGGVELNLLSILKAVAIFAILLKGVNWLSAYLEKKLIAIPEVSPSTRLMITKGLNIAMLFLISLIALNSIGINLTALAVFSGAIGVGVGFGLQKVVANFVSGLILLSDKSIKPGDVIQLEDVYGWVNRMGGRCVSVVTRDEKEYLIPNEDLITRQVINWSYSSKKIRVRVPVGISYKADPHKAIRLVVEAVGGIERILHDPPPICLLTGFGDSSVDLELRFWIDDPQNGVTNVTSKALLKVWDTFKEHAIEIPFPQRDVHLKLPSGFEGVEISGGEKQ